MPSYWEQHGYPGMDGVAWYRTAFDLDAREVHAGATVTMAAIDDDDITWVNGVEIGRTKGTTCGARIGFPTRAAHRAQRARRACRDGGGGGGINGAASLSLADGTRALARRPMEVQGRRGLFQPDGQHINKIPTILYNRMMHPLLPFAIKGVIWYQGESNANNDAQAAAYRGQFSSLITSWRREWGQPSI